MKYYFTLQLKIAKRSVEEWGIPFWLAGGLLVGLMVLLYSLAQRFPQYMPYGIAYLGLSVLLANSTIDRINFLKTIFPRNIYIKVKVIEHTTILFPLLLISVICSFWWSGLLLITFIPLFVFWRGVGTSHHRIPTPFTRFPFEFIVLFRKVWALYLLFYAIAIIGIVVSNFNLGIVMLAMMCLVSLQAYEEQEPVHILWNYSMRVNTFLKYKIRRGVSQLLLLILPLSIALCVFFPTQIHWVLIVWGGGSLLLALSILMKYASYPRKINILDGFIIAIFAIYPLLTLAIFPYYYKKASKRLKQHGL